MKQLAGISRFHDFWRFRISLNATVPGLKRIFFFVLDGGPILKSFQAIKKEKKRKKTMLHRTNQLKKKMQKAQLSPKSKCS